MEVVNSPYRMTIYHDEEQKETDIEIKIQSTIVGDYHDTGCVKFFIATIFLMASVIINRDFD